MIADSSDRNTNEIGKSSSFTATTCNDHLRVSSLFFVHTIRFDSKLQKDFTTNHSKGDLKAVHYGTEKTNMIDKKVFCSRAQV